MISRSQNSGYVRKDSVALELIQSSVTAAM